MNPGELGMLDVIIRFERIHCVKRLGLIAYLDKRRTDELTPYLAARLQEIRREVTESKDHENATTEIPGSDS